MFRSHLNMPRGNFGPPGKNKNLSLLTIVICCRIFDRRSVAPSSGGILQHLEIKAQAGAAGGGVTAW